MRYSKMLEESAFHGRRADYVWLLIVSCTILLVSSSFKTNCFALRVLGANSVPRAPQILSPLSPSPFLSSPLSFTLVYLWSRLNPAIRLSLFGVITIGAGPVLSLPTPPLAFAPC